MGKVMAVCVSGRRGVAKSPVDSAVFLKDWGIEGDAHAGHWHRQVSLLGADKIRAFNRQGAGVNPGDFGENLVVEGIGLSQLPVGALLRCEEVVLEITQIGKDCHSHCQIYQRMGECIMPREGVFARVLSPGVIRVGDQMEVERRAQPYPWQAAVITLSDRCAAGERQDLSGPAVAQRLKEAGYQVAEQLLLPDGEQALKEHLIRLADQRRVDLILTTGGTGFAPRDRTPEATMAVAHRDAPGIAQAIRGASMAITPRAMLSRGVSVIRGGTLIVNLPGSPRACMECMDVFLEVLPHALQLLRGQGGDCARP